MQETAPAPVSLHRVLGPLGVLFLTFSALSPVFSVYISGDVVLHMAGTGAAVAFLAGGIAAAILALLYAELGAAFPGAGGVYPGLNALLGSFMSFPYIVMMLPVSLGQIAFAALGLADYVRVLAPAAPYLPLAFASLAAATLIAVLNIRHGALVTGIFLAVEAVSLAILVVLAIAHPVRSLPELLAHPLNLDHGTMKPPSIFILGLATVSGVWTCGGASWALYFAEEMTEARRKIGRVIAWTGVIASLTIAAPMILMLMSVQDPRTILAAEAPFAAFLKERAGPAVAAVVSIGVAAAIFNSMVATIMAFSRYLFATGRDGVWPGVVNRVMGVLNGRLRSPLNACLILAVASGFMALAGERAILVLISGNVADYLLISLALFVGRRRGLTGKDYRAPLHPVVPIFGLAVTALSIIADWLDPDAGRPSIIILISLFLGALAYYHFRLRQSAKAWRIGGAEIGGEPALAGD